MTNKTNKNNVPRDPEAAARGAFIAPQKLTELWQQVQKGTDPDAAILLDKAIRRIATQAHARLPALDSEALRTEALERAVEGAWCALLEGKMRAGNMHAWLFTTARNSALHLLCQHSRDEKLAQETTNTSASMIAAETGREPARVCNLMDYDNGYDE